MLTPIELEKIVGWQPYRTDWPIKKNTFDEEVIRRYGVLIKDLHHSDAFDCTQTQDGSMTNYLEFICYPKTGQEQEVACIMVCVSLCAPLTAYGQTTFNKSQNSLGFTFLQPEDIGKVEADNLKPIESALLEILAEHQLKIVDRDYASQPLPETLSDHIDSLNTGNQILHGLFQWND